jgi:hypothetical protein
MVTIIIMTRYDCTSQGFDWITDVRKPTKYPYVFGGVSLYGGYSFVQSDGLRSTVTPLCGIYEKGLGNTLGGSIRVERWNESGLSSWIVNAGFEQRSYSFDDVRTYTTNQQNTETQYQYQFVLSSSASLIFAECFYKYRFNASHFHGSLGVSANVSVSTLTQQYGEITAPSDKVSREYFGSADDLSIASFLIIPKLQIGYDLDMGNGLYATPYFAIGLPLRSSIMNSNVSSLDLCAGVAIQYALPWFEWRY